jgi:tetratricopeptide (TPR) repeat protein
MRYAVSAGGGTPENVGYVQTLLGNLELALGHTAAARFAYGQALAGVPGYVPASVGLARVEAGERNYGPAIRRLRAAVGRLPLPEYVVALGETELAAGETERARTDLALVEAEQQLQRAAGVDVDVELAVFETDHGSPAKAVTLARRGWEAAPSVRAADALGWALTRSGDARAGYRWAKRALGLGSLDPIWRAHAGLSALAAGKPEEGRRQLRSALAHGLDGYPWQAQRVRRALQ